MHLQGGGSSTSTHLQGSGSSTSTEFDGIAPPTIQQVEGRPRWCHETARDCGRRVTVSFGPWRVALYLPAPLLTGYLWCDPPGLPADIEIHLQVEHSPEPRPSEPRFEFINDGYRYLGEMISAEIDQKNCSGQAWIDPSLAGDDDCITGCLELARAVAYQAVLCRGGLMLHAATLQADGRALVICGRSGAGKSTLSAKRFTTSYLGTEYAFVVPDRNDGWLLWWHGQSRGPTRSCRWTMPLGALLRLTAERNHSAIGRVALSDAVAFLVESAFWCEGIGLQALLDNALDLARAVPSARFDHCLKTPSEELLAMMRATMGAP